MPLFSRSEYQIGRGEVPESRVEAPLFAALIVVGALVVVGVHLRYHNPQITVALAITFFVFGLTLIRVEFGVFILLLAMLLSPEISVGQAGRSTLRTINLRYEDLLIPVISLGVLLKQAWEGRASLWRPNPILPAIVAYALICILSTCMAYYRSLPYWDQRTAFFVMLKMAQFYLIFVFVSTALRDMRQIRTQLIAFFAVALFICVYGLYTKETVGRVSAPLEVGGTEPNTMGGYLMIVMCLALGLYNEARRRKLRLLFMALALCAFFPFLFTLSRASYLALVVALLALGIAGRNLLLVAGIVLVLLFSNRLMPEDVKNRVNYTFQEGSGVDVTIGGRETGVQVDKSTYERIYVWQKVWWNLHIWPFLGGGVAWDDVLDSQYARVIIETGFFGMAAFLFMQWRILKTTRQAYRWSREWLPRGIALGTFAAAVGLMIHSMGTNTFLIVRIMEPFWYLVAVCVVTRDLAIDEYIWELYEARQAAAAEDAATQHDTPATPSRVAPAFN